MKLIVSIALVFCAHALCAQNKSSYGVEVVDEWTYHLHLVEKNPQQALVDLARIQGLQLDIRYATKENFTGEVIYPEAAAFARLEVAKALELANQAFQEKGYAIKIWDAYRPYDATVLFYELVKDTTYVASPYSGSRHNRGCALDLTLVDLESMKEIPMPTAYDDFTEMAHPDYPMKNPIVAKNRQLLISTMQQFGFEVYPSEWWHFDFKGCENYPILNLPFEVLKQHK